MVNELRIPPHDLEAEQALLGSCLHDRDAIADVLAILPPQDRSAWYEPKHADIYQAVASAYEKDRPIDLVVMRDELAGAGLLEKVGGVDYMVECVQSVPSSANAEHYAAIVRDKAILRRLIVTASEIVESAYRQDQDIADTLDRAERSLLEATQQRVSATAVDAAEGMRQAVDRIASGERAGLGLASGLPELDRMTNGFRAGELIIVAARPGVGKTSLGAQFAEHAGFVLGKRAMLFSLEMTADELIYRMLCSRAEVNGFALRQSDPDDIALYRLRSAAENADDGLVLIDESTQLTPLEMRAKARRQKDLALVVVDYLQLMRFPGAESRQQEVDAISKSLKAMAKEFKVPMIALAQLNRQVENREGHRPRLSDLRESGGIEQNADLVLLLHRPVLVDSSSPPDLAEVIVAKNRNGPTGVVNLKYVSQWTKFATWDSGYTPVTDNEPDFVPQDNGSPFEN